MALTDFLTSIADAIRYAESSSGTINAQQFATRIRALSGSTPTSYIYWSALSDADIEPNTKLTISDNVLSVGKYTDAEPLYYNKVSGTKLNGYISLANVDKVRLQSTGRTNGHTFVMTDNNMNVLWSSGANTHITELTEVDVPLGATRLYYTEYLNQTFVVEKQIADDNRLVAPTLDELNVNYASSVALQGDKGIYNGLKATFTFVLDDSIPSIANTYEIFKNNNIKTCSAVITNNLRSVVTNGDKCVIDVVKEIVADGGEVLSHHSGAITSETQTIENCFERNSLTKRILNDYGFEVGTIILAGGDGQDTIDFELAEKWSRMYYKMSDKYGVVEPYKHDRVSFSSFGSLNNFKASIDNAITNSLWVVYYMHGIDKETQVATYLNDALTYVANKVAIGDAEIKTYSEVYDAYYRENPHLRGTGVIGTNTTEVKWYHYSDTQTLRIDNNYRYGGSNVKSITASEYHANDTNTIIFDNSINNMSIGIDGGVFSDFVGCTEFIIKGNFTPRAAWGSNAYLPNTVISIKVPWSQSALSINPSVIGANANATVIYDYNE